MLIYEGLPWGGDTIATYAECIATCLELDEPSGLPEEAMKRVLNSQGGILAAGVASHVTHHKLDHAVASRSPTP